MKILYLALYLDSLIFKITGQLQVTIWDNIHIWSPCSNTNIIVLIFYNILIGDIHKNQFTYDMHCNYYHTGYKIGNSSVQTLPSFLFDKCSRFEELYLNGINMTNISPDAFVKLNTLRCLDISKNNLEVIHDATFKGLSSLTFLNLSENNIQNISVGAFKYLSNLSKLYLQDNKVFTFESNLFALQNGVNKHLQYIDISRNRLELIQNGVFSGLIALTYIDMSENNIKMISEYAFKDLIKLQELYLQENNITSIERNFFTSQKNILIILNISSNNLMEVNDAVKDMSVRILDMNFNKINKIDFGKTNIHNLFIKNNKINVFKMSGSFTGIVDVSNNRIKNLEKNIFANSITEIDLSHNCIEYLETTFFSGLSNLTHLYLQFNNLNSIPNTLLKDVTSLKYLDISHNNISELQYGLFDHAQSLSSLNISHNKFNDLQQYIISPLIHLEEFYFGHNEINSIDISELVHHCPSLRKINIEGNIYTCKQLTIIIKTFEKAGGEVIRGNNFTSSNVRGIACDKNDFIKGTNDSSYMPKHYNKTIWSELFNEDFKKSPFYDFFNKKFKDSNFFKYMDDLKKTQLVANKTDSENGNNIEEFNKEIKPTQTKENCKEDAIIYILLILILIVLITSFISKIYYFIYIKKNNFKREFVELM